MKTIIRIALVLTLWSATISALEDFSSQSFMFTHPAYFNLSMEQASWHDYIYHKHGPLLGSLQVVPFFESSPDRCDEHNKATGYFFPNCRQQLLVAGDTAVITKPRDIRAEWVGLPANFSGKLGISPEQKQYGALIEYHQDFKKFTAITFFKPFWFSIMLPFTVVKNNLNTGQSEIVNKGSSTTQPNDILQAFDQSSWNYGKFDQEQKKSGLAAVIFKIGAALYTKHNFEVDLYGLLYIPTSGKQNPAFLFSPYIGNNKHIALGSGINLQFPLTHKKATFPLFFFLNAEYQWFFHNKQFRTFDLKQKPFSRFLLLNSADGTLSNVPGVNVLTRHVEVKPESFIDFSTGFRARWRMLEAELGYDLWAHGNEHFKFLKTLCADCHEEVPLTDFGIAGSGPGLSASNSTIQTQAPDDLTFVTLNETNLNQTSAASRATITHKMHACLGLGHKGRVYDGFVNVGFFFEIPQNNAAFSLWGFWGKVGASF